MAGALGEMRLTCIVRMPSWVEALVVLRKSWIAGSAAIPAHHHRTELFVSWPKHRSSEETVRRAAVETTRESSMFKTTVCLLGSKSWRWGVLLFWCGAGARLA